MNTIQHLHTDNMLCANLSCFPSDIMLSPQQEAKEIADKIRLMPINDAKILRVQLCGYAFERHVIDELQMLKDDMGFRRYWKRYEAIEFWNNSFTAILGGIYLK